MINIDLLRSKDSKTIESLINRNVDKSELDKITEFDTKRRKLIEKIDSGRIATIFNDFGDRYFSAGLWS